MVCDGLREPLPQIPNPYQITLNHGLSLDPEAEILFIFLPTVYLSIYTPLSPFSTLPFPLF